MSTNYPTNLDTLVNPLAGDSVATVSHAAQHANANDAIEALQAKVGINESEVTTSHDYKLSNVTGVAKAVASDTYSTDKAGLEADISAVAGDVADLQSNTVNKTGNETVGGIKTFSSSPIVPDPTNDTDATNKQWVEGYVEGVGKENVGLLTQAKFIDTLTTNLRFSAEQGYTKTTLTGASQGAYDTLDGTTFIVARGTGADIVFYEYTLSGSAYTQTQTFNISSVNGSATQIKYLSSTKAAAVYDDGSGSVYISYLQKSGTWSLSNTINYAPGTNTFPTDIHVVSDSEFYIGLISASTNHVKVRKCLIAGGTLLFDGTYSEVVISQTTPQGVTFNSATELFTISNSTELKKFSFSSGTSSQIGSTTTITSTSGTQLNIKKIASNKVIIRNASTIPVTYTFDGTNFIIESRTSSSNALARNISTYAVFPAGTYFTDNEKIVLTGTGYENSIEDLGANGHIGHMISQNESFAVGPTFSIIGSTGNDGSYTNTTGNSLNKVIITTAPAVTGDMVCTIQPNLSTRNGYAWRLKGSNYYLGTN